jgi:antitoxin (DNA-binding transcriptional repressor) of toxin-antitoxin stability system
MYVYKYGKVRIFFILEANMKTVSPTELRNNIYKLLDDVLNSGVPLEINRGGKLLRILPVAKNNKLANLESRPGIIVGNPDDLVDISWEKEVNLDLH